MRVLWFTSVMPPAVSTHLGSTGSVGPASWVESLRQALAGRDDLDLAIASPCPTLFAPFSADGVSYYGMPVPKTRTRVGQGGLSVAGQLRPPGHEPSLRRGRARLRAGRHPHPRNREPLWPHRPTQSGPGGHLSSGPSHRLREVLLPRDDFARDRRSRAARRASSLAGVTIHGYWRCVRMAAREREIMRINRSFIGRTEWDRAVLWAVNPAATYYHCDEVLRPPFYGAVWQREAAATADRSSAPPARSRGRVRSV